MTLKFKRLKGSMGDAWGGSWEESGLCRARGQHEDGDPTPSASHGDLCERCDAEERKTADFLATATASGEVPCTECMTLWKPSEISQQLREYRDEGGEHAGCPDCLTACESCGGYDDVRSHDEGPSGCVHCEGR